MIYWIDWAVEVIEAVFEVVCLWLIGAAFVGDWSTRRKERKEREGGAK